MTTEELHTRAAAVHAKIDLAEQLLLEAVTNSGHRNAAQTDVILNTVELRVNDARHELDLLNIDHHGTRTQQV